MNMISQRKIMKIWNMKLVWLSVTAAVLFLYPGTSGENIDELAGMANSSSVLILSNKNLTLNENDVKILNKNRNITQLYLNNNTILVLHNYSFCNLSNLVLLDISNNSIKTVEQAAFAGLNQLTTLNLQNNKIAHLDSSVFVFLKSMKFLNLQNNNLGYFDNELSLNLTTVTLMGNPWNCSCGLLSLQTWLTNPQLTLENEKNTTCTSPDDRKTQPIKTVLISNCDKRRQTEAITKLPVSINPSNCSGASAFNDTNGKSSYSGFQRLGKSWSFLIGVLIFTVTTTMLIITAIKFPVWYRHLISYNHRRLDEDEPEMFEEHFSTDTCGLPSALDTNVNDSIVVFERFHTFFPEEDGFIEDKYIDT